MHGSLVGENANANLAPFRADYHQKSFLKGVRGHSFFKEFLDKIQYVCSNTLNMKMGLGQLIAQARHLHHKTLRQAAKEISVSPALLSMIERERHIPPKELIVRLAELLGGDPDRWCALAGKITPEAEQSLAELAKEEPEFFRKMVKHIGGR